MVADRADQTAALDPATGGTIQSAGEDSNRHAAHGVRDKAMDPPGSGRHKAARSFPSFAGVAALCALVPVGLALSGAFQIQVTTAAAGAVMTTGGFALARAVWPGRRQSDLRRLLLSVGFFVGCAGVILMLAGIGIYH